jgi:uncharacterized membrane protein
MIRCPCNGPNPCHPSSPCPRALALWSEYDPLEEAVERVVPQDERKSLRHAMMDVLMRERNISQPQALALSHKLIAVLPSPPVPQDEERGAIEVERDADSPLRSSAGASEDVTAPSVGVSLSPEREALRQILDLRDTEYAQDPADLDQRSLANHYARKLERVWALADHFLSTHPTAPEGGLKCPTPQR